MIHCANGKEILISKHPRQANNKHTACIHSRLVAFCVRFSSFFFYFALHNVRFLCACSFSLPHLFLSTSSLLSFFFISTLCERYENSGIEHAVFKKRISGSTGTSLDMDRAHNVIQINKKKKKCREQPKLADLVSLQKAKKTGKISNEGFPTLKNTFINLQCN